MKVIRVSDHAPSVGKFLERAAAARRFKSVPAQLLDALRHKVLINTALRDYHRYEFFKAGLTMEEKSRYVGLTDSRYWPYENNPGKFAITLTDKYVQKTLLQGFGLPTPRVLTTIGQTLYVRSLKELTGFLKSCDRDVVVKPISSSGGKNILVLTRKDGGFYMGAELYTPEAIWAHVSKNLIRGFLVEERVANAQELAELYPNSLNTFRVITIKTNDGRWHIAGCALKLGRGGNLVDNLGEGGIELPVDRNDTTYNAYDFKRYELISHHPDTGLPLNGRRLSCIRGVRELGLEASEKFHFMGTIGWDIAVTPDGPLILEGNTLWGPIFQIPMGSVISDEIAKGLNKRNMFSRWFGSRPS